MISPKKLSILNDWLDISLEPIINARLDIPSKIFFLQQAISQPKEIFSGFLVKLHAINLETKNFNHSIIKGLEDINHLYHNHDKILSTFDSLSEKTALSEYQTEIRKLVGTAIKELPNIHPERQKQRSKQLIQNYKIDTRRLIGCGFFLANIEQHFSQYPQDFEIFLKSSILIEFLVNKYKFSIHQILVNPSEEQFSYFKTKNELIDTLILKYNLSKEDIYRFNILLHETLVKNEMIAVYQDPIKVERIFVDRLLESLIIKVLSLSSDTELPVTVFSTLSPTQIQVLSKHQNAFITLVKQGVSIDNLRACDEKKLEVIFQQAVKVNYLIEKNILFTEIATLELDVMVTLLNNYLLLPSFIELGLTLQDLVTISLNTLAHLFTIDNLSTIRELKNAAIPLATILSIDSAMLKELSQHHNRLFNLINDRSSFETFISREKWMRVELYKHSVIFALISQTSCSVDDFFKLEAAKRNFIYVNFPAFFRELHKDPNPTQAFQNLRISVERSGVSFFAEQNNHRKRTLDLDEDTNSSNKIIKPADNNNESQRHFR